LDDLRQYETVRRWLAEPTVFQPVREDPQRKIEILRQFCELIDTDPDTLIATCTDLVPGGGAQRNQHLKTLKVWVSQMDISEAARTRTENVVRGFLIKNGIKVMTRPYSDVYRKGPGQSGPGPT